MEFVRYAQTGRAPVTPDRQPDEEAVAVERLACTLREIEASTSTDQAILLNDLLCAAWPTRDSQNQ